MRNQIVIVA